MTEPLVAILDASAIYKSPLRDFLVRLALSGLFRARWTGMIHDEWMANLKANRPDLPALLIERTRALMDSAIRDCLVIGFEEIIPTLLMPDPGDRHVLAAAIHTKADLIVTFNLKHFPETILGKYGVMPMHPDTFVCMLWEHSREKVLKTALRHRLSLKKPAKTSEEYIHTLFQQGLLRTAELLSSWKHYI